MPRISGVDIPLNKRIEISLTYIYGIGRSLSGEILKKAKIDKDVRTKNLTEEEVSRIRKVIENEQKVEGELRRIITQNIRRLKEIGSYRGIRHKKGLPVRGQRTRSNARTKRGKRVAIGTGKKKKAKK